MERRKGFTLIEMLVVITILGIIFTMVYQNFFYQEKAMRRQRQLSEMNVKARKASHYIVNELRHIGFSGRALSPTDHFGIVIGASNSISYTHDLLGDNSGVVDAEDIHSINSNGDTLFIDGDWALRFLDTLMFRYIDDQGNTVTSLPVNEVSTTGNWVLPGGSNPISRIEFTLRLVYPSTDDTISYETSVALRNLRP